MYYIIELGSTSSISDISNIIPLVLLWSVLTCTNYCRRTRGILFGIATKTELTICILIHNVVKIQMVSSVLVAIRPKIYTLAIRTEIICVLIEEVYT